MFVIYHKPLGGFIEKSGGWNIGHTDPQRATLFKSREDARAARPGHPREMGGSGYVGRIVPLNRAIDAHKYGYEPR